MVRHCPAAVIESVWATPVLSLNVGKISVPMAVNCGGIGARARIQILAGPPVPPLV
ncbi:Uncharacterised protein [Mycobacteroides abscessus]|nr:Uncharacterised protein [Mycobacteroides abscessus]